MTSIPTVPSVSFTLMITPKLRKDWHAALNGYKRIKPISGPGSGRSQEHDT